MFPEKTCLLFIYLGPYDFDNSAQVRDALQSKLAEKAEEQEREMQKYREALYSSWHNGTGPVGRILDINFPGRLILYFAFDVSGSVGKHNFDKSIEFAKAIVKRVSRRYFAIFNLFLEFPSNTASKNTFMHCLG